MWFLACNCAFFYAYEKRERGSYIKDTIMITREYWVYMMFYSHLANIFNSNIWVANALGKHSSTVTRAMREVKKWKQVTPCYNLYRTSKLHREIKSC